MGRENSVKTRVGLCQQRNPIQDDIESCSKKTNCVKTSFFKICHILVSRCSVPFLSACIITKLISFRCIQQFSNEENLSGVEKSLQAL